VHVSHEITNGEQAPEPDWRELHPFVRRGRHPGVGRRTLAEVDKSWKYINVRRLFNYVESSNQAGTRWAVFEPTIKLWAS